MRKNNIYVFSKIAMPEIERTILSLGHFDCRYFLVNEASFEAQEDFFDFLAEDTNIIICKNDQIDPLVSKMTKNDDTTSLIFEQAVKLENEMRSLIFLPIELDAKKFLTEILGQKESYSISVFGKTALQLEEKLQEIKSENEDFDYYIITNSPLSHIIFSNTDIQENFSEILIEPLGEDVQIAVADAYTYGKFSSKIEGNVKKSFVLCGEDDFVSLGVENSQTKENAYALATKMLEFADLAVVILGGGIVAVGNREQIVVSSANLQNKDDVCDFARFKIGKFLKDASKSQEKTSPDEES